MALASVILNTSGLFIRFTLKDGDCKVVANTLVQLAVYAYGGGNVANPLWMVLEQKATPTTDANGLINIPYTGTDAVGDTVYVAVLIPGATQSVIWTTTVQN